MRNTRAALDRSSHICAEAPLALSFLGERVERPGIFPSRGGPGEGLESWALLRFRITNGWLRAKGGA